MYCTVCSRTRSQAAPVYYFSFPLDNRLTLKKWLLSLQFKTDWEPTRRSRICSLHFKASEVTVRGNSAILDPRAVPVRDARDLPDELQTKTSSSSTVDTHNKHRQTKNAGKKSQNTSKGEKIRKALKPLAPAVTIPTGMFDQLVTSSNVSHVNIPEFHVVNFSTSGASVATDTTAVNGNVIPSIERDPLALDEETPKSDSSYSVPNGSGSLVTVLDRVSPNEVIVEVPSTSAAVLNEREAVDVHQQGRLSSELRPPASHGKDCRIVGTGHSDCVNSTLSGWWSRERFADVLFICTGSALDSGQVRANASVLAAASPLMRKLLKEFSDLQDDAVIHLPDVNRTTLVAVLHYVYTGSIIVRANGSQMTELYNLLKEFGIPASPPVAVPRLNTIFLIPVGNLIYQPLQTVLIGKESVPETPVLSEPTESQPIPNPRRIAPAQTTENPPAEKHSAESKEVQEQTTPKRPDQKAEKPVNPKKKRQERQRRTSFGKLSLASLKKRRLEKEEQIKTRDKKQMNERKKKNKQSEKSDVQVACADCGKMVKERNLAKHKKTHEAHKFSCSTCGRTFVTARQLRIHCQVQHPQTDGSGGCACQVCGKVFKLKKYLNLHMRVHTGEKPFPCKYCDRRFRTSTTRKNHQRTHTGEKPHQCHLCEKAFAQRTALAVHLKRHEWRKQREAEKAAKQRVWYKCDHCPVRFRSKADFLAHEARHTGESPLLPCDDCDEVFTALKDLRIHRRQTHKSPVLLCDVCGREFFSQGNYYYHIKKHKMPTNQGTPQPEQESNVQEEPAGDVFELLLETVN